MIRLDSNILSLDKNELVARMMCTDIDTVLSMSVMAEQEVKQHADCFYSYEKTSVTIDGDTVTLGFGNIKSRALAKNLEGCKSAYVVAVSLGHGVDRLLRQKSVGSTAEHFTVDAVASTLCEALCDRVQSILPQKSGRRFSPGYGDLDLNVQPSLLQYLGNCGIGLTESGLMIPSKSVTFIAGVKE